MSFICEHCKGSFNDSAKLLDEQNHAFCCNGCKNVYAFLRSNGLGEFYTRLGKEAHKKASEQVFSDESAASMFSQLIKRDENRPYICELIVLIDGMHCSACVWLNEKSLSALEGVLEIEINASTNKARILFDQRKSSLCDILNHIVLTGYMPKPFVALSSEAVKISREYYAKLIVGLACTMNIMWVAIALYSGYFTGITLSDKKILHFAEFVLASPAVFYTGSVFYASAIRGLKMRQITMDFNISVGILVVYFYSVYAMLTLSAEVYFDSACMLVTFIFIGKFLQNLASKKAVLGLESISMLFASKIYAAKSDSSKEPSDFSSLNFTFLSPKNITKNDFIMLRAGERAMIDGKVVSGEASIDNSLISGESLPTSIGAGAAVTSGMLCVEGSVIYRASASFEGSFLSALANLLSSATFKKPQIEQKANQISSRFGLVILILFTLTLIFWSLKGSSAALSIAISVLVIACPCALSLATPIASVRALALGFKKGIIFREARVIEALAKCNIIAFDKTGTLSHARLKVRSEKYFKDFDKSLLFSLLSASSHPISQSIAEHLKKQNLELKNLENVINIPSKGIKAKYKNQSLYGGSLAFVSEFAKAEGGSIYSEYFFGIDDEILAHFELEDELKNDAKECIKELKNMGLSVLMLSGDKKELASEVAKGLGIDECHAELDPIAKVEIIKQWREQGGVAMIGDGINDTLALQNADVGVCMGSGASISVQRSDVVLLRDDLASLLASLRLARKSYGVIKENLAISLIYNALSIPLAMMGFVIPLFAAISMSASSLLVVLNSLKLR